MAFVEANPFLFFLLLVTLMQVMTSLTPLKMMMTWVKRALRVVLTGRMMTLPPRRPPLF